MLTLQQIALDHLLKPYKINTLKHLLNLYLPINIYNSIVYYISFRNMLKSHRFISTMIHRIYTMPFNECDSSLYIIMYRGLYGWESYWSFQNDLAYYIKKRLAIYLGRANWVWSID